MNLQQFLQKYRIERDLGKGSYGKVKLAVNVETGQKCACKFISKASLRKKSQIIRVNREIRLLKLLNHPNIIKLYDAIETETDIVIITEYVEGGELFEYIQSKKEGLPDSEATVIFCQVLSAVEYCHANRVVHRDLKPENLLFDSNGRIKLIDFGFSNIFDPINYANTFCGSPYYAAPEVIEGKKYIGPEADLWSLGIILYILVTGRLPFVEENLKSLCAKIKNLDYIIPDWVSNEAADLIRKLLRLEQFERICVDDIKQHPLLMESLDKYYINPTDLVPFRPVVTKLDDFILRKLESYGLFPPETVINRILTDHNSPQFSCYYLLKERFLRETKAAQQPIKSASTENSIGMPLPIGSKAISQSETTLISNGINLKRSANSIFPMAKIRPDIELPIKIETLIHEMTNILSKIRQITNMVLYGSKFECSAGDTIFNVKLAKAQRLTEYISACVNNQNSDSTSSVYIEFIKGSELEFQEIRKAVIKYFV